MLTLKVNYPAPEAEFKFILLGSPDVIDSSTAHIGNDYLYFHCTGSPMCEGFLEWKNANGITLMKWNALSGCNSPPCKREYFKLPNYTYTIKTRPEIISQKGCCDPSGFCWWVALYPRKVQNREGFGIHPDGPPTGTKGCIGITNKKTRDLYNKLRKYIDKFNKIKVKVE